MLLTQLCAKVETFFQIGLARSQFAANRKIAAPGPSAARHTDLQFGFGVLREELTAQPLQSLLQPCVNAVPGDVKESARATRPPDFGGYSAARFRVMNQRADAYDGDG